MYGTRQQSYYATAEQQQQAAAAAAAQQQQQRSGNSAPPQAASVYQAAQQQQRSSSTRASAASAASAAAPQPHSHAYTQQQYYYNQGYGNNAMFGHHHKTAAAAPAQAAASSAAAAPSPGSSRVKQLGRQQNLKIEAEADVKKKIQDILTDPMEELEEQYIEGEVFDLPRKYKLTELRGKGSYGVVCAAMDQKLKTTVAVKKNLHVFPVYLPNENVMRDVSSEEAGLMGTTAAAEDYEPSFIVSKTHPHRSAISQLRILRELKILIHLSHHPNIINLRDVVPPRDLYSFSDVYFVTDLMEADLRDIIDSDQELTNDHIQYFMYQILIAMNYMHAANILHRDLKPENILLNSDCELKICDFGLARGMEEQHEDVTMSTAYVQTRWYRAPELLLNNPNVNKQVDMWSVGCIFAELLARQVLFRGSNPLDQLKKIINILGTPQAEDVKAGTEDGKQFVFTSIPYSPGKDLRKMLPKADAQAIDLLKKLLHFNPEKRISAERALHHPYFSSIFNEEDLEPARRVQPFDYSFEEQAQRVGLKEVAYQTIVEYNKNKLRERINKALGYPAASAASVAAAPAPAVQQAPAVVQQQLPPAIPASSAAASAARRGSLPPDSPVSQLLSNFFTSKHHSQALQKKLAQAGLRV